MADKQMTVEAWVELLRGVGLGDEQLHRWHADFERRHPEAHESFLQWLGLPADRIAGIRRQAAAG